MRSKTGQSGVTLAELMIVVAILALISAIATPVLLNSLPNMRLRSAARDIYSTMALAKTEALRRGITVTVLFTSPDNTYTMFLDNGAGGHTNNQTIDGDETVIATAAPLPSQVTLDPNLTVSGTVYATGTTFSKNALLFSPRGLPVIAGGGPGGGTVGLRSVDSLGNTLRQLTVTVSNAGSIAIH